MPTYFKAFITNSFYTKLQQVASETFITVNSINHIRPHNRKSRAIAHQKENFGERLKCISKWISLKALALCFRTNIVLLS